MSAFLLLGSAALASPNRPAVNWTLCAGDNAELAITACSAIIGTRGPDAAMALYDRGRALRLSRQFDRALADLTHAIRLQPDLAAAYVERGIVRYQMGQYARAIADNDTAIRLKPNLAEAFNNRALARLKLGQYELATADFDRTIRLHQYYGNALINRSPGPMEPTP